MVATSQNGYSVKPKLTNPKIGDAYFSPGLRDDDAGYVLAEFLRRFDKRVEKLVPGWCWGYAYRPVRGALFGYSNHASGTGADINAPRHPLGKRGTFTTAQVREFDRLLAEFEGVIRAGKDYTKRADEMHVEIDAPYARVKALAAKLRAQSVPKAKYPPTLRRASLPAAQVPYLRFVQRWLGVPDDGEWGSRTEAAILAWKRAHGIPAPNDTWGRACWAKIPTDRRPKA